MDPPETIAGVMALSALIPLVAGTLVDSLRKASFPSMGRAQVHLATLALVASLARVAPASGVTPPPIERLDLAPNSDAMPPPEPLAHSTAAYRVEPGDSLWAIACRTIRQRTGKDPAAGAINAYWRAIYETNRDVIGSDPDLIFPGQSLVLP